MAQRKLFLATMALLILGSWAPLAQAFTVSTDVEATAWEFFYVPDPPLYLRIVGGGSSDSGVFGPLQITSAGTSTQEILLHIRGSASAFMSEDSPGSPYPSPTSYGADLPLSVSIRFSSGLPEETWWFNYGSMTWSFKYTVDGEHWEDLWSCGVNFAPDFTNAAIQDSLDPSYGPLYCVLPLELGWCYDAERGAYYAAGSGVCDYTISVTQTIYIEALPSPIAVPCPPTLLLLGSGLGGLALYRRWWKFVG